MKKSTNDQQNSSKQSSKPAKPVNTNDSQKTLFQCWKSNSNSTKQLSASSFKEPQAPDQSITVQTTDLMTTDETHLQQDEDDLELIKASDTFLKDVSHNETTDLNSDEKLTAGIDDQAVMSTEFFDTTGFDFNSGSVWIYPNNMTIRSYQFSIVEQCLYKNTMVVLPTGMGKTLVAAVVMYNFYRWYPFGKVIFMAPTKPLVNQQSDACYKIVGIPKRDMTQMTGQMAPDKRKILWDTKRVFFLTPQVISNDILRGTVDVNLIKCVVIDEAHKALGEYAFCKVIESINEVNKNFRIIALTATPGSDIKAVQNVITKLLISHIELRSDESIDIQQYNNHREVNKFVLSLTDDILRIKNAFNNVMKNPLKRLEINRVLSCKDPNSLHKLLILDRREQFRKNIAPGLDQRRSSLIECDLALLVTLIHALELLIQYGVKSFYMFLKSFIENSEGNKSASQQAKLRTEIYGNSEMSDYYEKFKQVFDAKFVSVLLKLREPIVSLFRFL